MNRTQYVHPLVGAAQEALTEQAQQVNGPLSAGYAAAVAEETRSHDDAIDPSELAPVVTIEDEDLDNYRWGRGDYRGARERLSDLYGVSGEFR